MLVVPQARTTRTRTRECTFDVNFAKFKLVTTLDQSLYVVEDYDLTIQWGCMEVNIFDFRPGIKTAKLCGDGSKNCATIRKCQAMGNICSWGIMEFNWFPFQIWHKGCDLYFSLIIGCKFSSSVNFKCRSDLAHCSIRSSTFFMAFSDDPFCWIHVQGWCHPRSGKLIRKDPYSESWSGLYRVLVC